MPKDADEATIQAAIASGMLLIPELTGPDDRSMPDADRLLARGRRSSRAGTRSRSGRSARTWAGPTTRRSAMSTLRRVREAERAFRKAKPGGSPLTTGTVVGMLPEYARFPENLDVVGIPTAGWATAQDPLEMFQYLEQRRSLTARSNADALLWAMHRRHRRRRSTRSRSGGPTTRRRWGQPRVQPEQIRIATYAAIAAGCRGICFRADSDLTRDVGRPA